MSHTNRISILSQTFTEFAKEISLRYDKGTYHSAPLYREVFRNNNFAFINLPEFASSPDLAKQLTNDIHIPKYKIDLAQNGQVVKFATTLNDGEIIESVIIPTSKRVTLCVSSQAGCRMGCTFCATGSTGFVRDLSTEEIVAQVYNTQFILGYKVDNIVFMGMGEPLDNLNNVMQAIRVMTDQRGLAIPQSNISVSTSGHIDGIRKLAASPLSNLKLAVSVNAADNDVRNALMPINKKYPLDKLKLALMEFPHSKKTAFFIEYVIIAGVNDSREMAEKLVEYLDGLTVRVNLIAYNQSDCSIFTAPSQERVKQFRDWLVEKKLFVRIRQSYGSDINAACGQLRSALKK